MRRAFTILGATILLGTLLTASVSAGVYINTIDPTATLDNRHLEVTGPIGCDAGERLQIRATVTQRHTGAVAEGQTQLWCTGDRENNTSQTWEVKATTRGRTTFDPGAATVCALAVTYDRGQATDSHQWCEDVNLVDS